MTSDSWEHIFALFDAALGQPEADRQAFLSDRCGDDGRLRQEVESLLAAHGDASGFLSGRPSRTTRENVDQSAPASHMLARGDGSESSTSKVLWAPGEWARSTKPAIRDSIATLR